VEFPAASNRCSSGLAQTAKQHGLRPCEVYAMCACILLHVVARQDADEPSGSVL
jgi:hypothetical protein